MSNSTIRSTALFCSLAIALCVGCDDGSEADAGTDAGAIDSGSDDGGAGDASADAGHVHGPGTVGAHIHAIHFWGDTEEIVIGTHAGTYRTEAGSTDLVPLTPAGDFMGLVHSPHDADVYWGSGHWAAGGFANWGFIESTDACASFTEITLSGTVDFHHMAVNPDLVDMVAGTFMGNIYVSTDAGRSWDMHPWAAALTGLEIEDPTGPVFLVSGGPGIQRVTAPAMTTEMLVTGTVTGLDRQPGGFVYGTIDGAIHLCDETLTGCTEIPGPSGAGSVHFLVAEDGGVYALTGASEVHHTHNAGVDWELLVSDD